MKSIDTYLCREKKEVYKINTNIIIPQANRLYTMQEIHDRLPVEKPQEPLKITDEMKKLLRIFW